MPQENESGRELTPEEIHSAYQRFVQDARDHGHGVYLTEAEFAEQLRANGGLVVTCDFAAIERRLLEPYPPAGRFVSTGPEYPVAMTYDRHETPVAPAPAEYEDTVRAGELRAEAQASGFPWVYGSAADLRERAARMLRDLDSMQNGRRNPAE